jgi:hypothetical protein
MLEIAFWHRPCCLCLLLLLLWLVALLLCWDCRKLGLHQPVQVCDPRWSLRLLIKLLKVL